MPDLLFESGWLLGPIFLGDERSLGILKMFSPTPDQVSLCARFGVTPAAVAAGSKIGISRNVRSGLMPLNGMRHSPEAGTTGWFIWAGEELSSDPDFFAPLHIEHLNDWSQQVWQYVALPAGWRFLIAPGYEDVWFDESLILDQ